MAPGPLQDLPRDGRRRRQDLPDAAGGPRRAGGGPRRRDRLPRAAQARRDRGPGARAWRRCRGAGSPTASTELEEMDLPAVLAAGARAGADRRARPHQRRRASSTRSATRTSRDVLAAGIDVFSTVNVQHLESLNDQVAELTGARVRETIPDAVLGDGRRGRADRPHPRGADRAPARGQDLPRRERSRPRSATSSSREPRCAARGGAAPGRPRRSRRSASIVEEPLGTREERVAAEAPQAVGERLLALVRPQPSSQRLVRRAWRSAQRLGHRPRPALGEAAGRSRSRASWSEQVDGAAPPRLGARRDLLIEESDDLVARRRRASSASAAAPTSWSASRPRPRGFARLREPLPQRLMRGDPAGVDVRIVAHRGLDGGASGELERALSACALIAGLGDRLPDRASRAAAAPPVPRRSTRSSCPSPAPRSRGARSTRRCGWPAPRGRR